MRGVPKQGGEWGIGKNLKLYWIPTVDYSNLNCQMWDLGLGPEDITEGCLPPGLDLKLLLC